jgi:hypothetical protein
MCMLIALFEWVPGRYPCWMWYDCQTALRLTTPTTPSDTASAAVIIRSKITSICPCPVHNPDEWAAQNLPNDGSISRIGQVSDIASDSP